MKDIGKLVTEEIFIDSHKIISSYICDKRSIQDINLILLSEYLTNLTSSQVRKFYKKYIETGLIYSLPEFYSSDLVTIPKGIADVREYRFFSSFGMVLYNSIGIFFAEICNQMIKDLDFKGRKIFSFSPTVYIKDINWKVNNDWQKEYVKFKEKISAKANEADVVLSVDISNFFNSIQHKKLISCLGDFISSENRKKYNFDSNSEDIIRYYLQSMMGNDKGLPQGRKNFASDYLAFLYMIKFDMEVESLVSVSNLEFVGVVRYVDDIHIFFKNTKGASKPSIYKSLSKVEHSISKWLYRDLGLSLNDKKTQRKIIYKKNEKDAYVLDIQKRTSQSVLEISDKDSIPDKVKAFSEVIQVFSYPNSNNFESKELTDGVREKLKLIFNKGVQNVLANTKEVSKFSKTLEGVEFELSSTQFDIFHSVFNIKKGSKNIYESILLRYLKSNFNPKDKRHIHILLIVSNIINNKIIKNLIVKSKKELLSDDYGKYLLSYFFKKPHKNKIVINKSSNWNSGERVYDRICLEREKGLKSFPFINSKYNHSFLSILSTPRDSKLDPLYTALCGYVHEFNFSRWSSAFNRLQMIVHESVKYLFNISDHTKGKDIIKALKENGFKMSTHEERDFLCFWERRNFNPASHGSKNGLTTPEVTFEELVRWEEAISVFIKKIFNLK